MKDKRTYTNLKEHGIDMTYENESKVDPKEDRGPGDLTYLIEMHKKEIWEWKQKESEFVKADNLLKGSKQIINELSNKLIEQGRIITNLNNRITDLEKQLADKSK